MKYFWTVILTFFSLLVSLGQDRPIVSFTIDDGMQNGSVQSIVKGSDGYIYIGTFTGITRYDGKNAVNIPISENNDAKYNIVYDILEVAGNKFYVGTTQGLWLLDATTLNVKRIFKENIDAKVTAVKQAGSDILVATAHGLFRIDGKGKLSVQTLYRLRKYNDFNILDLDVQHTLNGYVAWALTANGLVDIDLRNNVGGNFHPLASLANPQNIAITNNGNIAVGTSSQGVWMYSSKTDKWWQFALNGQSINDVNVAPNGNLLVATEKCGAMELNPQSASIVYCYSDYDAPGFSKVRFSSPMVFYRDEDGIDWVGYKFYGLDHTVYNSGVFEPYFIPNYSNYSDFHPICCLATSDKFLIGTRKGLVVVDATTGGSQFYGDNKLGASRVSTLYKLSETKYIIGIDGNGIKIYDVISNNFSDVDMPQELRNCHIYQIKPDRMGHLWLCTSLGLVRFDTHTSNIKLFDTKNSQLPNNEVYAIDFDLGGRGWVSTNGGNCMYLPTIDAVSVDNMPRKITEIGALRDIQRLEDGRMMFLPQRGFPLVADANVVKMSTWKFDVGEDAPNISFFIYRKGWCYFSTDNGFWVNNNKHLKCYNYADGLLSMEFLRWCVIDDKERCMLVTNKGISISTLRKLNNLSNNNHIPIVLTQIQTDRWLSDANVASAVANKQIRLERSVEGFSLQFQALTYSADSRLQYMYKLEGFDDDWIMANSHNTASYRTLPWGTYKLKIKVLGKDNIYSEYTIDVPMAYSTMVMIFAVVLLIVLFFHVAWCKYYNKEYIWRRLLPKVEPQKYQSSKIAKADAEKVIKKLLTYVEDSKPYLNPDFSMTDLAKAVGVSNHTLSQIFTQYMHRNYYDFVGEYRVAEFKKLANMPEYSKFTIMAIAEKCGFKSRTSFFTAFKNHAGCTPKEYLEKRQK